jgi:hypothetical protein
MRRISDYEAAQNYSDEQEADVTAVTDRIARAEKRAPDEVGGVSKELQLGEEAAKPTPIAPRPWMRSVAYTRTGIVAVPRKQYHQTAQLIGANNVAFEISYRADFPTYDTIGLTGDRTHTIRVFAGQEIWMRSQVMDGNLSITTEPYLGAYGQTLETEGDGLDQKRLASTLRQVVGPGSTTGDSK